VFEREPVDEIVVNAAGCGSTLKEYGHLLADDPDWAPRARAFASKVRDVTETLAHLGERGRRGTRCRCASPTTTPVTSRTHKASATTAGAARAVPGVSLLPVAESDICCGSAGIFNLVQTELADQLGRRKADHLSRTGADVVVTSNPAASLQIRPMDNCHVAAHRRTARRVDQRCYTPRMRRALTIACL
jgi:glycolate oxidase iron-sulfur subunit